MDRVFVHLRHVRCHTCSRVFCCAKHRVEHERMSHVDHRPAAGPLIRRRAAAQPEYHRRGADVPAAPVAPLIRRRFRSGGALENRRAPVAFNRRKRMHAVALGACAAQSIAERLRAQQQETNGLQGHRASETPARNVLRAARRAVAGVSAAMEDLRPVAESSPTAPGPSSAARGTPGAAEEEATLTLDSAVDSPPSMYQTPMQTPASCSQNATHNTVSPPPDGMFLVSSPDENGKYAIAEVDDSAAAEVCESAVAEAGDTAVAEAGDTAVAEVCDSAVVEVCDSTVTAEECDTPTGGATSARKVSLGENSAQKGFFWTNMARRFRLALRPARPRPRASVSSSPATVVPDVAKFYGNIQPRQPIHTDDASSPAVNARPTLEELRQAHAEANRIVSNASAERGAQP